MLLTSLRLINFKCFQDSGEVPLAPLTLIFGRNNTGKSSILQSLLLLRQTLDSPEYGPRLNLRGPLYPAGTYGDIVHHHLTKQHIEMRFGLNLPGHTQPVELEFKFCSDEPQSPRLIRLKIASQGTETLQIRRGVGKGGPYELVIGGRKLGGEKEAEFRFPVNGLLPLIGQEPPHVGRPSDSRKKSRALARKVLAELESEIGTLRAVGAFRQQPSRRYEYQGRVPDVVDSIGKNVVSAIIEDSTRRGRKKGQLSKSVNRWLKQVGRVRLMPLRRISRSARIFEIRLQDTDSGRWANFADVGFGIGQAFPVLVEGLRTPVGGTFLVQEPEIHLHPDAQLAMADFLIDLASVGKHVIVETHSEHLLLRVRHRIIEAKNDHRRGTRIDPNMISVIHIDKQRKGTSRAKPLALDELGQIEKWPKDFMGEATEERMAILEDMAKLAEPE